MMANSMDQKQQQQNAMHYMQKQKGAQIVRVEGTESQVSLNLAAIVPNFSSLQATSSINNDMYYQIRSFRCRNPIQDLVYLAEVEIVFKATLDAISHMTSDTTFPVSHKRIIDTTDDPLIIKLSDVLEGGSANVYSPQQIVQALDQGIVKAVYSGTYVDSWKIAMIGNIVVFGYDQVDKTLQLQVTVGQDFPGKIVYNPFLAELPIENDYYILTYVEVQIMPRKNSVLFNDESFRQFFQTYEMDTASGRPVFRSILNELAMVPYAIQSAKNPFKANLKVVFRNQLASFPDGISRGGRLTVGKYRQIYIRSSLLSNLWTKEGKKSNVIAVIPLKEDEENYQEYRPCGADTRIFDIKDSLNSIQHMQITLTDENENLITFQESYSLEIAIFFLPENVQSINF